MGIYSLKGLQARLEPLGADNWVLCSSLLESEDLTRASLLYPIDFNLTFSADGLRRMALEPVAGQTSRLYLIRDKEGAVYGITGITDIDWVQRRGLLLLLMGESALREKRSYEPLKLLLIRALREWDFRRVVIPVFLAETQTVTVLKGFGFQQEGVLRKHVFFKGESFDVGVFGILKSEFHHVEV
ncbi:GNAT family N-acetyltransferase [Candidatus Fermentibacteria bacterium]|nr:GNAT family N-acetyltransferase [Candidatus Fermentibacteria bacterium]